MRGNRWQSWLNVLAARIGLIRVGLRPARRQRRVWTPRVEMLEDRLTPAILTVNSLLDNTTNDGFLTLREAILSANANANVNAGMAGQVSGSYGADTIVFDASLFATGPQTITLTNGALNVTSDLTITGPGARLLTISGNDVSRVFNIDDGNAGTFSTVSISGVTITDGRPPGGLLGGGILSTENLTVTASIFVDNFGRGAGIGATAGSLTVTASTFTQNRAEAGFGTITLLGGSGTIVHTTIANTIGSGGIYNGGTLHVVNSTITGNGLSGIPGGGINTLSGILLELDNSIVAGNVGVGPDIRGTVSPGSFNNFIGDGNGMTGLVDGDVNGNHVGTTAAPLDPRLGTLQDNGGTTPTRAPLADSPVINAGDASQLPADTLDIDGDGNTSEPLPFDQRGAPRIIGALDIGAVETLLVDTIIDEDDGNYSVGDLSLREAIFIANLAPGLTPILFDPIVFGTPQTITLTLGELLITGSTDLRGPGRDLLTIDANQASRVFNIANASVTVDVSIGGVTITGGKVTGDFGGGVFNTEALTVRDSAFTANTSNQAGGAIFNFGGTVAVERSTFTGNQGGSLGGAIDNAGGGAAPVGVLTVRDSTFTSNSATSGGAIVSNGLLTVLNSTFAGNSATLGGAIRQFAGTANLWNSTFSGNKAASGGAVYLQGGSLATANVTITGNRAGVGSAGSGGGIFNGLGTATLANTIVAGNFNGPSGATADDLGGNNVDTANSFSNLIGAGGAGGLVSNNNGNFVGLNVALVLDPVLRDNGGLTQTHALLSTSPALDAGDDSRVPPDTLDVDGDGNTTEPLPFDQRGLPRFARTVDIGAVEADFPVVTITANDATADENAGTTGQWTLTRSGDTAAALTVDVERLLNLAQASDFTLAVNGGAFNSDFTQFTFAAGAAAATVALTATADVHAEADEAVTFNLLADQSGATYVVGLSATGTVVITQNDFVVINTADSGEGSLRQAVANANFFTTADTITFQIPGTGPHTIALTSGQLTLTDVGPASLTTITGPAGGVTVSRDGAASAFRIVELAAGVHAAFTDLTIANGDAGAGNGGGILVGLNATLSLTDCTIRDNQADAGAGISSAGTVTLTDCVIDGNTAADNGGGIDSSGKLTLTDCTITDNQAADGGGVYSTGTLTLTDCTVSGNSADARGGGVAGNAGTVVVIDCTFQENDSAGRAGGLYLGGGDLSVIGSTFTENTAARGGGLHVNNGTVDIANCTFSGNSATDQGGGLGFNLGTIVLTNITATGNRLTTGSFGGGVFVNSAVTSLTLANSIVAGNLAASTPSDIGVVSPAFTSMVHGFHSLIGDAGSSGGLADGDNGNIVGINGSGTIPTATILDPVLRDNGGLTLTHALLSTSPAVDAGDDSRVPPDAFDVDNDGNTSEPLAFDQRGLPRFARTVDIGAVEADFPVVTITATDPSADENNPGANTGVYRIERTGDTSQALTVHLTVDAASTVNQAGFGDDYDLTGNGVIESAGTVTVVIAAGQSFVDVTLTALVDIHAEADEALMLDLAADSAYVIGAADSATVAIAQNDFVVINTNDGGEGSLRQAVENANFFSSADTITFQIPGTGPHTVTLTGGVLILTDTAKTTIQGPTSTAADLVISGGGTQAVFIVGTVAPPTAVQAEFRNLTIADGNESSGAGIYVNPQANLTLTGVTVRDNVASVQSAGLYNSGGTVTITDSTFTGNDGFLGGAIFNTNDGTLTITHSTITDNHAIDGAALQIESGTVRIETTTIDGNTTEDFGNVHLLGGDVVIVGSTLSNNTAQSYGGAIDVEGPATLFLVNSTVSGNATEFVRGGGIMVNSGSATIVNSTITGNHAGTLGGSTGGGLAVDNGGAVLLHNTIIAGNYSGPGTASPDDIIGTVDSASSFNLIGNAFSSGGLSDGDQGNIVGNAGSGTIDITTVLNTTLAANGGPTKTHALVNGSQALDAGGNALAVDEDDQPLTSDQRGAGFARIFPAGGTVDIGAYEAAFLATDDSIDADEDVTVNGDVSTNDFFDALDAVFELVGPGPANDELFQFNADGTFSYRASDDFNGSDSFTYRIVQNGNSSNTATVNLNVRSVNDAPSFKVSEDPIVRNEDAGAVSIANWASFTPGPANEAGQQVLQYEITNVTNGGLFATGPAVAANGTLTFTTAANANGTATFDIRVQDDGGTDRGGVDFSAKRTVTVTINAVNDAPSFSVSENPIVRDEDAGAVSIANWASFNPGPANEAGQQVLQYEITNVTNGGLFATGPAVAANGTLTFTTAANANGTATFDIRVQDDGGTDRGGVDFSAKQTITITLNAVNDAPSFTVSEDPIVRNEDVGAVSIANWASFNPGPADEAGQQVLQYEITNVINGGLFASGPAVAANGTLTFTTAANANGTATFDIRVQDNGGTDHGGVDFSAKQTITITLNAVNDAPDVTATTGSLAYTENDLATAIDPGLTVTDLDSTTLTGATVQITGNYVNGEDILAFTNQNGITGSFTAATGTLTLSGASSVANYQTALASVTYRNTSDNPATALRTVTFTVNDGAAANNTDAATRTITVSPVNDAPTVSNPASASLFRNGSFTFSNASLISVADVDANNGTLKLTLKVTNGTLTLAGTTGLTFDSGFGNGTAEIRVTGTLNNLNAALNGLVYRPTANTASTDSLAITINDQGNSGGGALQATASVDLTVTARAPRGPVGASRVFSTPKNTPLTVAVGAGLLLGATSPDNAPLSIANVSAVVNSVGTPTGTLNVDQATGTFTYTPPPNFSGPVAFTYQLFDGQLTSDPITVTINVTSGFTKLRR